MTTGRMPGSDTNDTPCEVWYSVDTRVFTGTSSNVRVRIAPPAEAATTSAVTAARAKAPTTAGRLCLRCCGSTTVGAILALLTP